MPQDGRRSVGYRPFVTCDDPKGVVECGTIRKINKSNYQKMEPSNEARVRPTTSNRAVDREELSQASFQLLEVSKGAQKLNHMIESWSNGISVGGQPKDIAKDLLKGALDLQESLVMLGKLQAASKHMARLKRKQEKLENSGMPGDLDQGQGIGFSRLEVSPGDEPSRKKIEELREVIRSGLARHKQLDQRKFEQHFGIPSTSSSQSSSANYDEKDDLVPDKKAQGLKAPNIIAKLMGLEEISLKPIQRKLQDKKIMEQQKPDVNNDEPKLKKPERDVPGYKPDRKTLKELLDNMQFKGPLKSNLIRKTPSFNADDVPPIVLIKPSRGPCPVSSGPILEGKGASNAITVLKSLKANEKFSGRRMDREEIVCDSERIHETPQLKENPGIASCQRRGSTRPNEEISKQEKARDSERDSNKLRHPSPPVKEQVIKEKRGMNYGEIQKATKGGRRSPEKAYCKAKSLQQSEDQVKANALAKIKPENRPNHMKREVSPRQTLNRQDQKKETSTPEVQRSKKTVCNQQTRTPSQSCRNRKINPRKKPPKNNAEPEEDGVGIETTCQSDSVKLETNTGNEDPHFTEESASESGVGVSKSCSSTENSPTVLSPSAPELRTETDVQKLDFEAFETGDHIKSLLLSTPSFLSRTEDLLAIVSDTPALLRKPTDADYISPSERLLLDYADELMECRTVCTSINSLLVVGQGSLRSQISLDNLSEEILKGIENLSSYCKLASNSFLMDGLYAKLKRDLSVHRKSVSKLWDPGWTEGFCSEDADHVVNEVEENVLGSLIEETLIELVQ